MNSGSYDKEEILALLVVLGNTADAVAEELQELGIRGSMQMCTTCPIAKYLVKCGIAYAAIDWYRNDSGEEGVSVYARKDIDSPKLFDYSYPLEDYLQLKGVRDFILAFDDGRYPQCRRVSP